ncbi:unnamed protein product [Adineta ricciae]|uniref:Uncharacterized protein n=3 Tax=Adineta ricciae TaxID=249248 RepID=A0A815D8H6_ADIRI|nr:unnamed protein product [Adineta ricciae]
MARWGRMSSMLGSVNEYSHLKWPLTFASLLTTLLAFILLLSFRSDAWFTYELIHVDNTSIVTSNSPTYSPLIEYGSLGLWSICNSHYDDPIMKCDLWTRVTRPHYFNVIIVLITCALFLSNLTVFPSWGASILILYNTDNRYIRHIVGFIWILLLLTLISTIVLIIAILLIALTQFYSPGRFTIQSDHLYFRSGPGLHYASFATFLSIICLILIIVTLLWKKMIEMKNNEAEKDLLRQLTDDYQPGWHRMVIAPRTPLANEQAGEPPPYEY